ncbi:MAG: MaoC/PaaZ C-terminal domain-containing protein [Actinomycetota bacterium]|nr:MaoC family dehydratase N-terminal domain-containing protein [Actinomycetota bacterium]
MPATVKASDVNEGEELKPWTYQVQREDLLRYANASGDQNPIHQDEAFAKSVGLPDVIAHGMQTMAKIGQYVTDWAGDPGAVVRFKTRFTKPVVVPAAGGSSVTISGRVIAKSGTTVTLQLTASTMDGSCGEAEADVELS